MKNPSPPSICICECRHVSGFIYLRETISSFTFYKKLEFYSIVFVYTKVTKSQNYLKYNSDLINCSTNIN